ncbi:unnamed protein product [Nesidiocoris tenuis]|uniref:Uncharacterized protein n=1 Tax=Nesidiocoris tenuis TaxID=355587 RepID=A0A6H5HQJ5_9HEMI|nr:unnamed protein product [Nesidiocoris tenuis]
MEAAYADLKSSRRFAPIQNFSISGPLNSGIRLIQSVGQRQTSGDRLETGVTSDDSDTGRLTLVQEVLGVGFWASFKIGMHPAPVNTERGRRGPMICGGARMLEPPFRSSGIRTGSSFEIEFQFDFEFQFKFDNEFEFEFDFEFQFKFENEFELKFDFEFQFEIELKFDFEFQFKFENEFELKFDFEFQFNFENEFEFRLTLE